ncbi:hypothetical protein D9M71_648010 [compost metagenome]
MIGQPQVVVVTERQQRLAINHHLRPLRAFEQRTLTVEIFGTTGSKACGEIERHAGLDFQMTQIPCGSGLARESVSPVNINAE